MKEELHKTHNSVPELGNLHAAAYENIFSMYKDEGEFYSYNITRAIRFPDDLNDDLYYYHQIVGTDTWTKLSFDHYGTIQLWWLICSVNKILNPVLLPDSGTVIKILKPIYVSDVIEQVKISK